MKSSTTKQTHTHDDNDNVENAFDDDNNITQYGEVTEGKN